MKEKVSILLFFISIFFIEKINGAPISYIGCNVGYTYLANSKLSRIYGIELKNAELEYSNGANFGLGFQNFFLSPNYDWLGFGADFIFNYNDVNRVLVDGKKVGKDIDTGIYNFSLLANVIVRYPSDTFEPYLGLGAGFSTIGIYDRKDVKVTRTDYYYKNYDYKNYLYSEYDSKPASAWDFSFAYQAFTGIRFTISETIVDVRYTLRANTGFDASDIGINMKVDSMYYNDVSIALGF